MKGQSTMKHTLKSKLVVLCGLLLLLSGCTEVAITGRKQFNIVPDSTMNSMGFQSYSEFLTKSKLSKDFSKTQMVKRVGSRIQKAVEHLHLTLLRLEGLPDLIGIFRNSSAVGYGEVWN